MPMEFEYSAKTQEVHVEIIDSEPWFVASDVCNILELTNPTESLKALDDDEKLTSEVLRAGQQRKVNLINESGLYNLIFRSNKPEAKKFRKWVTNEVLPSIRKTGSYGFSKQVPDLRDSYASQNISEMLTHAESVTFENESWFAGVQLQALLGKSKNGDSTAQFRKLEATGEARKMAGGHSGQIKWYVKRSAVGKLLKIRPNSLPNIAIIKSLKEGGLL